MLIKLLSFVCFRLLLVAPPGYSWQFIETDKTPVDVNRVGSCDLDTQFQCVDGGCIKLEYRCDTYFDCGDHSDESLCFHDLCSVKGHFECVPGKCIPGNKKCDGHHDCWNGSDELDCDSPPEETQDSGAYWENSDSVSHENPTTTEPIVPVKDATKNAKNQNMEADQPSSKNKVASKNDGDDDVIKQKIAGIRAAYTKLLHHSSSHPGECSGFQCENGDCISEVWRCDTKNNCPGGEDEENCETNKCPQNRFSCGDGYCIFKNQECDTNADCPNGKDEEDCEDFNCGNPTDIQCLDGPCIPEQQLCDGITQCAGEEDELLCLDMGTNSHHS